MYILYIHICVYTLISSVCVCVTLFAPASASDIIRP